MSNCFCNLFENESMWWIIILILLVLFCNGNGGCDPCGCPRNYNTCGCNSCGCN